MLLDILNQKSICPTFMRSVTFLCALWIWLYSFRSSVHHFFFFCFFFAWVLSCIFHSNSNQSICLCVSIHFDWFVWIVCFHFSQCDHVIELTLLWAATDISFCQNGNFSFSLFRIQAFRSFLLLAISSHHSVLPHIDFLYPLHCGLYVVLVCRHLSW